MQKILKVDFVRFCIVGVLGFLINYVLLSLIYKVLGSPIYVAQAIAAEVALFSNFMLHHHWTYKASKVRKTISVLIMQFHITSWVAIVGSVAIVSLCVNVWHIHYAIALILSSAIALFWNYAWSKFVIWRRHEPVVYENHTKQHING